MSWKRHNLCTNLSLSITHSYSTTPVSVLALTVLNHPQVCQKLTFKICRALDINLIKTPKTLLVSVPFKHQRYISCKIKLLLYIIAPWLNTMVSPQTLVNMIRIQDIKLLKEMTKNKKMRISKAFLLCLMELASRLSETLLFRNLIPKISIGPFTIILVLNQRSKTTMITLMSKTWTDRRIQ
jgi:hypothetical protein